MPSPPAPTLKDVFLARRTIAPHLAPTPLVLSRGISRLLDCEAYLKLETLQPVGAFKALRDVPSYVALWARRRSGIPRVRGWERRSGHSDS